MTHTSTRDAEPATDARSALIRAATRLFAERGIYAVSLREITRAAGQRNTTALQYHFTNREGLLREVLIEHGRDVGARRNTLLDQYELTGRDDLRALASALVLPLIAKLSDPAGGREYLQITAELLGRTNRMVEPGEPAAIVLDDPGGSLARWLELVAPMLPPEAVGPPLHRRFAAIHFAHLELSRRAKDDPRSEQTLFTHYLTDLVAAVLAAPVSDETKRVLATRQRS
ncbi:helix-turn-helix domain-containing protein [Saccharopolyspora sp. NPDC050389]|uniref:TetR/AcrR family transcriptional regulator n=1 Tax=Saccharopolyspora sp. NPDC050389 TaxID=3155516 RepID=UPI0033D1C7E5